MTTRESWLVAAILTWLGLELEWDAIETYMQDQAALEQEMEA